jgi:uncharacterized membrane protein YdbT with pleckstrin-like domain
LENYESNSSVEAGEDTNVEAGVDPAAGVAKFRRRTRSTVVKKSASAVAAAISTVKVAEQNKKRKRRAASPPAVATPTIPTPRSQEVGSEDDDDDDEEEEEEEEEEEKEKDEAVEELPVPEDQAARRPESPAAKRQRELVQKTSEEALRRGLEAQRNVAATQAKIPAAIKPRVFWQKTRLLAVPRYKLESWCCLYAFYLNFVLTKYFCHADVGGIPEKFG